MSALSYSQARDFLFKLESSAIKLGLDNTVNLLDALGNPHRYFRSVHIAGTNGKGSVASFLNSILYHNRLRTGLFTSPHLVDYRERIRLNGEAIPPSEVGRLVSQIADHVKRIGASYFEATTAVAFEYFRRAGVDVAVVEVGMGGRLDSTNVIAPLATCITTIGFDHEKYLGRTLSRIAGEKAGTIKERVPVVCGVMPGQALRTLGDVARRNRSPVFRLGEHARVVPVRMGLDGSSFDYKGLGPSRRLRIRLVGDHQIQNAALAVLVAEVLGQSGLRVSDGAIEQGLLRASWPGRLQVLRRRPLVICDGAHNASGVRALVRNLNLLGLDGAVTVFGVLRDKSYDRMLVLLADRTARFVFTKPAYHRALPVTRLAEGGRRAGVAFTSAARSHQAIRDAIAHAFRVHGGGQAQPPVLICGSLYLVGEAMQFFGFKPHLVRLC